MSDKLKTSESFGEPPGNPPVALMQDDNGPIKRLGDTVAELSPQKASELKRYLEANGVTSE